MSWTVDAGVAMSGSSESSNEKWKWIYSGPIDALVSSYLLSKCQIVTNKCNAGLIDVATGQTDFISIKYSQSTIFGYGKTQKGTKRINTSCVLCFLVKPTVKVAVEKRPVGLCRS